MRVEFVGRGLGLREVVVGGVWWFGSRMRAGDQLREEDCWCRGAWSWWFYLRLGRGGGKWVEDDGW